MTFGQTIIIDIQLSIQNEKVQCNCGYALPLKDHPGLQPFGLSDAIGQINHDSYRTNSHIDYCAG
jgi:hypothetical protein